MSNDVRVTVAISTREALVGTMRTLLLTSGKQTTISIPTDAYEGQLLWFPGHVKDSENDAHPGTLFLTVQVDPEPSARPLETPSGNIPDPTAALEPDPLPAAPPPLYHSGQPLLVSSAPAGVSQRRQINKMVILALAALLVISSSGATFFFLHTAQTITQANATATAINATAASRAADATATDIVNGTQTSTFATATVQAQGTATMEVANPDPYAGGKLIFYDKLDGTGDQITTYQWTDSKGCTFSNGTLHALDDDPQYLKECQVPGTLTNRNFAVEVTANILRGDTAQIFFRGLAPANIGYFFSIVTTGHYLLTRLGSGMLTSEGYTTLLQGNNTAIRHGYNQINLLAVVAQGSTITLYVNGQRIGKATDTNFDRGEIGLVASTYANHTGSTEVAFSNLRIWQIGN